jgi:hypothetical protein
MMWVVNALLRAIVNMVFHSCSFDSLVMGSVSNLLMLYLNAAILYSYGGLDEKCMVVSVLVGFL